MLFRILKISFLFFIVHIYSIYAQQLALKNYTVEEGLAQSSVSSIIQDKNGFMWFGTEGGVSKYDGVTFVNYSINDGLLDNMVLCMMQDSKGAIWVGTKSGGISKFDGKKFVTFDTSKGLADNLVYSILEDNKGFLWIGTANGLCKFDGKKFYTYTTKDGLQRDLVRSILKDRKGNLIFCYGQYGGGITRYDGKSFTSYSIKKGTLCDEVVALFEDDQSNIWIGTYQGIFKYYNGQIYDYSNVVNIPSSVTVIYQDKYKNMWFGTENGIYKYENGTFFYYTTQNGLNADYVQAIFEDKRGDLWFGLKNGGAAKFSAERFVSFTKKDGLSKENVYAINEFPSGTIWLGTDGAGVYRIINNKLIPFTEKSGLTDGYISSFLVVNDKSLWVGTTSGAFKYENNHFTNFNTKNGLAHNTVYTIKKDEDDILWFGTEIGLSRYDGKNFTNFTTDQGLIDNTIYSILVDIKGNKWLGTVGGLSKFDGKKFVNYTLKDGLVDKTIFALAEDGLGNIWIGTQGGVSVFDGTKFKSLTTKEGLSDNICSFFTIDKGYIYIGTNKGIDKLDLSLYYKGIINIKVLTAKDGLPASECAVGGSFEDSEGNLWFGTVKGVTKYNNQNIPNLISPPIFITTVKVMDKPISWENKINLKYSQNYIRIEYKALSFVAPEKITYKFILEGIDDRPHETDDRGVTFSSLKPGEYKFRIIAKSEDGIWSKEEATVSFVITPPFYETYWFRSLMIIAAISSVYSIFLIKTRQVKKRNEELALMVKERTSELEQEKNKSDELLHNILPGSLVDELKNQGYVLPREFKNVSILFTDFKGFTYIAAVLPADKLVNELNEMFKNFDLIIEKFGLEKLKTIGDSYMVGAGLPKEADDHAIRIILAGLEMQQYIIERNKTSAIKWDMRAGVHSGHVIAGVVGTKKFTYDIWGDTVNIASRMESAGAPGEINISAYTYMLVRDYFECEYRGKVTAKGKGELDMYFVKGIIKNVKIPSYSAVQTIA